MAPRYRVAAARHRASSGPFARRYQEPGASRACRLGGPLRLKAILPIKRDMGIGVVLGTCPGGLTCRSPRPSVKSTRGRVASSFLGGSMMSNSIGRVGGLVAIATFATVLLGSEQLRAAEPMTIQNDLDAALYADASIIAPAMGWDISYAVLRLHHQQEFSRFLHELLAKYP